MTSSDKQQLLRQLPGVDHLLELSKHQDQFKGIPRSVILEAARTAIDAIRKKILAMEASTPDTPKIDTPLDDAPQISDDAILEKIKFLASQKMHPKLVTVINGTGVVLHTNLGRALLCEEALENITTISKSYSNLELNIETGKRGIRYAAIEELICDLTGAESAIAVNNNAGAVLLALNTIAQHTQVVVSRGELVEIGGSFRVPDVMEKSGCILKEVGTTNRTHLRDYDNAITDETGLLLKVHTSNYKIEGFTKTVSLEDLVHLGKEKHVPVMEDLGSGTLIDFSPFGLPSEPTIRDSVRTGADIVTFSGDKLLGGPQAGIIVGKKQAIEQIKKNPMTRALRIDKMTLAALESTLKLYRDKEAAIQKIPTLRMLTMSFDVICQKAALLQKTIQKEIGSLAIIETADMNSRPGGGSFPELNLATRCVTIAPKSISVSKLEKQLRLSTPSIIGRIEDNKYILDPRTIQNGQEHIISSTLAKVFKK